MNTEENNKKSIKIERVTIGDEPQLSAEEQAKKALEYIKEFQQFLENNSDKVTLTIRTNKTTNEVNYVFSIDTQVWNTLRVWGISVYTTISPIVYINVTDEPSLYINEDYNEGKEVIKIMNDIIATHTK